MGILDIIFENLNKAEMAFMKKSNNKYNDNFLIAVINEIIRNNNYDYILDEDAKDVFQNKIGREALIIDLIKANIDYYCSFLLFGQKNKNEFDLNVASKVVNEIIMTNGCINIQHFLDRHNDDLYTICKIYINTIFSLDQKFRYQLVNAVSNILVDNIEKLNNRQRNYVLDKNILVDRNIEYQN